MKYQKLKNTQHITCAICSLIAKRSVHHVAPRSYGGPPKAHWNLVELCEPCHQLIHELSLKRLKNELRRHHPSSRRYRRLNIMLLRLDDPLILNRILNYRQVIQSLSEGASIKDAFQAGGFDAQYRVKRPDHPPPTDPPHFFGSL